ncbi:MAG TPA: amino acid racemase [Burkholderiaceae bacterium]|nr:amino acid racemase [Burkholderiaceae bacterium]
MAPSHQQGPAAMDAAGIVGVLGGMGPLATIDFMRKMLQATPAVVDQEHVPVVVSSIPQVPDRTQAFRREGASPLAAMLASGRRLVAAGAGLAVIPCNTAHLWFDEIQQSLSLPMLHLVDAALEDAVIAAGPGGRIGLLATDATLASGLYVNRALPPGAGKGVQWVLPTAGEMLSLLMPGVAAIKAGQLPVGAGLLMEAVQVLQRRGAMAVVLGCTEIPLVLDADNAPLPVVDATAALARRAVAWSLAQRG